MRATSTTRGLCILAAVTIAAFMVIVYRSNAPGPPETLVEGRPISDWINELGKVQGWDNARTVLSRQTPIIIPNLLKAHSQTRSISTRFTTKLMRVQRAQPNFDKAASVEMIRGNLLLVISDIGKRYRYSTDFDPELQAAARAVVEEVKNDSRCAKLLGEFGQKAASVRSQLIEMVREGKTDPALLGCIAKLGPAEYSAELARIATNQISPESIELLGACGEAARPAIPLLTSLLDEQVEWCRSKALVALARIGQPPAQLKPRFVEWMDTRQYSTAAAVLMLQIDQNNATASNIVSSRLHPLSGEDHLPMIELVAEAPTVAILFEPQLEKLAGKTNEQTCHLARQTLRRISMSGQNHESQRR
jgi:hypothetical protein